MWNSYRRLLRHPMKILHKIHFAVLVAFLVCILTYVITVSDIWVLAATCLFGGQMALGVVSLYMEDRAVGGRHRGSRA